MEDVQKKIDYLNDTKTQIKEAIVNKGVEVPEDATFRSYPSYIDSIESGGEDVEIDFSNSSDFNYLFTGVNFNTNDNAINLFNMIGETNKIKKMIHWFSSARGCSLLDFSKYNLLNVKNFQSTFDSSDIDNSIFSITDFSQSENTYRCFAFCNNLTGSISVSLKSCTNIGYMFRACKNIEELTITEMKDNMSDSMFFPLGDSASVRNKLHTINIPSNFIARINVRWCSFTKDGILHIFNQIGTFTGTPSSSKGTITLTGNPGVSELTEEEIAIATDKGWTVIQ